MTPLRFAIHAHVYYRELWPELATCIRNFADYEHNLFITTPHADDTLRQTILTDFPSADYRVMENRGYDVGPFIEILNNLNLDDYDFIVKLHTKRDFNGIVNLRYFKGSEWRERLFDFCSTSEKLEQTIASFLSDQTVGMIAHGSLITERGDFLEDPSVCEKACDILSSSGLKPVKRQFVAGSCFIVRTKVFKPLHRRFSLADFDKRTDHRASLAHALERVFGYLVLAQERRIKSLSQESSWREQLIAPLLPLHRLLRRARRI